MRDMKKGMERLGMMIVILLIMAFIIALYVYLARDMWVKFFIG